MINSKIIINDDKKKLEGRLLFKIKTSDYVFVIYTYDTKDKDDKLEVYALKYVTDGVYLDLSKNDKLMVENVIANLSKEEVR
jgi:hypothetical protein